MNILEALGNTSLVRLRNAMATRAFDQPVDTVRLDDHCALGKWLYGSTLTPSDKATDHYRKVIDLHAAFHDCAARVLDFALAGKNAEAEEMMAFGGGEYPLASSKLVMALSDWKKVSK